MNLRRKDVLLHAGQKVKIMGYSPEAYEKAELILSAHRRRAAAQIISRTEEVYLKIPRIKEIEDEITACGIKLTRLALPGASTKEEYAALEARLSELEAEKKAQLVENNYPEDYLTNVHSCTCCRDTGYVSGKMCDCLRKLLSGFDFNAVSESSDFSFEKFRLDVYSDEIIPKYNLSARAQMKNILDYCKDYVQSFSPGSDNILMYGGAGLGKTYLCNCIASGLSSKGFNVILSSSYNIFEVISKNKFNFKADLTDDIDRYYECDLLIMDDLGTEFVTEYTVSSLFDIINYRLTHNKPMIINANLSLQDMSTRYSDRVVSRLLTFRHLLFLGSDIRAMKI